MSRAISAPAETFDPALAPSAAQIFICYAHDDHEWLGKLLKHLGFLRRDHRVNCFSDREIRPGEQWEARIREEIDAAQIIVALLSANFAHSNYCNDVELNRVLARRERKRVIIPVILTHVDFEASPLARFQPLPLEADRRLLPLAAWRDSDEPLAAIARHLRQCVREVLGAPHAASQDRARMLRATEIEGERAHGYRPRQLNALDECAYLSLSATQGSGPERIGLNAELRMNEQQLHDGTTALLVRLHQVRLALQTDGCEVMPGQTLGDEAPINPDPMRSELEHLNPRLWKIQRGQAQVFLKGYILGEENLCDLSVTTPGACRVRALLTAYRRYLEVEPVDSGKSVLFVGKLTQSKLRLLKIIVTRALGGTTEELLLSEAYLEAQP